MSDPDPVGGFAFPVRTESLGGGEPMLQVFAVRFTDVKEARKQLVMRQGFSEEQIGEAYPLANSTFDALQFDMGDCDTI